MHGETIRFKICTLFENGSQSLKRNNKLFRLPLTAVPSIFYLTSLRSSFCCASQTCLFLNNDATLNLICASCYCCSGIRGMCSIIPTGKEVGIPNYGAPTWSKLSTQVHSCIHASVRTYVHKLGISISVRYSKFFVVNFPSRNNSAVTSMRTWRGIRTEVHEGL